MMSCINCGAEVHTAFCPACGQRSGVKRLTFRDTLVDIWQNLAGFDGVLLRTLADLTRRPGKVARSYIAGVRIKYFGPVAYFFFMITLLLVWVSVLGMDFADLIRDRQEAMALARPDQKGVAMMTQWIGDNIKWFLFLAVPFQAVAARIFFFRHSGFNSVEHTVPLFYASGHLFWLTMISVLLRDIAGNLYAAPLTVLTMVYFGYLYADLMHHQSRVKAFLKGVGVYLVGQLLFVLTLTVLVILVILALAVVSPDSLELFRPSRR